jgi:hypothetical protein
LERRGEPELSIFWTDRETGLRLKCRVDWFSDYPLDLKTTRDPSPMAYARQYAALGYHRKRAHYRAGIFAHTGEHLPFVHLATGTEPPHEVAVYDPDDSDYRSGRSVGEDQYRATLRQLAECFASADWSNPWESQVTRLELPGWAFSEDQYQWSDSDE